MGSYYTEKEKKAYRDIIENAESTVELHKTYPTALMCENQKERDVSYGFTCPICGKKITINNKTSTVPLIEQEVACPGSTKESPHGVWASVINVNLN